MTFSLTQLPMPLVIVPDEPLDDDALFEFCSANDMYRIERESTGELRVMSPTGMGTGSRNLEICRQLGNWARQDGRGVGFDSNTGWTLPDGSMLSPDASWLERGKLLALSDRDKERFAPICPPFVIELRSKSDRRVEVERKMELWMANGAEVGWLIDPFDSGTRSVTVYRAGEAAEHLAEPSTVQGTGVVVGFELVMGWVWEL